MDATIAPALDPTIIRNNLKALRTVDAAAARAVESARLPDGAEPRVARDGRLTFVWRDADGAWRWLGRTSLPDARATGLIDAFEPGGGNVLCVGCGAGTELRELLRRTAPHAAVFLVEPDAANLAMVLRLLDFSSDLAARRLRSFAGDAAWEQMRTSLLDEPGLLAPDRVLAWPWFTPAESQDLRAKLTALATEIGAHREDALRTLWDGLELPTPPPFRECRCIAVVSIQPDPDRSHIAQGIAWGAAENGRRSAAYCVDAPTRVHALALGRFIRDETPDAVILIDATRGELGDLLPGGLRVATWISPKAAVNAFIISRLGADDLLIVSTPAQAEAARGAGVAPDRIVVAPPAGRPTRPRERKPLLVIADGADVRPQAAGVHLASHVALWEAAARIIGAGADEYHEAGFDGCFAQAEVESGVRISDATVRNELQDRIRTGLAPALLNRTYVDALMEAGIEFDLFGDGWASDVRYDTAHRGRRPDGETAYGAALHLTTDGRMTCELLDAVVNGATPLIRYSAEEERTAYFAPGTCTRFRGRRGLVDALRNDARRRESPATEHVRAHHTWKQRVSELLVE